MDTSGMSFTHHKKAPLCKSQYLSISHFILQLFINRSESENDNNHQNLPVEQQKSYLVFEASLLSSLHACSVEVVLRQSKC